MNNFRQLALGLAVMGAFVPLSTLAGAQQEPLPYQHVPLPNQLPKGVSIEAAKRLQALIDDYKRQEPLMVTKIRATSTWQKAGLRERSQCRLRRGQDRRHFCGQ